MSNKVRVRYAPSPTGYQHIGGIRTALFNFLFARVNKGDFILRIEDTDQTRFFDGALEDIFETFKWLGIDYDEGPGKGGPFEPYFQSKRTDLYKKYANELIEKGHAYRCFCTSERLAQVRSEQEKNKTQTGYDRRCRDLSKEEVEEKLNSNTPYIIRFKAPLEGKTVVNDRLFDKIEVENSTLQDFVLLKTDGFPTYHLANIVDDHLMEITHVLRAQEWIPSTPNHVLLYKAFGWEYPEFIHLPMVTGEDGKKLSKRHGSTQVKEFKTAGYLPEAIVNFVALLGWSYNDKDEIFSMDELKKKFNIDRINKSPAIFNFDKLKWFNGVYIRKLDHEKILAQTIPLFIERGLISKSPSKEEIEYIRKFVPMMQERLEFINDAPELMDFMFGDLPPYKTWEAIIPKKTDKDAVIKVLNDAKTYLKELGKRKDDDIQHDIYELTNKYGVKAIAVFMPLRIAITGKNKSPELFPIMNLLGVDKVIKRIDAAVDKLKRET